MTNTEDLRAKVFISCGQQKGSERHIADGIKAKLEKLGYEAYVAVQQQTLQGLKENIFRKLETSEYFVFIDFKREELKKPVKCRGSLFSHQELAIASYLGLEVIALQESGVAKGDGLMKVLQVNSKDFAESDREHVPRIVAEMVRESNWSPHWKNQLEIAAVPCRQVDIDFGASPQTWKRCRFFQISVTNRHRFKPAVSTCVYLERLYDKSRQRVCLLETTEFKWSGFEFPYALIAPGSERYFDGFFVVHENPTQPLFLTHTTSGQYRRSIPGQGDYELTYAVVSQSFPPVRATFQLHVGQSLDEYRFELGTPSERAGQAGVERDDN